MSSEPGAKFESEPESDSRPLPVNLHFPDQRSLTVDIDAVMRRGLRMRRNRKVLAGTIAAVAVGVLGASAAYLVPATAPAPTTASSSKAPVVSAASPTGFQGSSVVRDHPAAGGHITVLDSRVNPMMGGFTVSVVAWLSDGQLCSGAADLTSSSDSSITCASRPSELSATAPTALAPYLVAGVTTATGQQLVIGFTSGDIAKVSLKIRGHLYDAAVVALPGSPPTGAYMVWTGGADFVRTGQDFTQITGYDSQGAVVAASHS